MLLRTQLDACLRLDLLFYLILIYIFNVTTKYYLMKIRSDSYLRPSRSVNKQTIELLLTKYLTILIVDYLRVARVTPGHGVSVVSCS